MKAYTKLVETFPNGITIRYEECSVCDGQGSVLSSWGERYYCDSCGCSGRRVVKLIGQEIASR